MQSNYKKEIERKPWFSILDPIEIYIERSENKENEDLQSRLAYADKINLTNVVLIQEKNCLLKKQEFEISLYKSLFYMLIWCFFVLVMLYLFY